MFVFIDGCKNKGGTIDYYGEQQKQAEANGGKDGKSREMKFVQIQTKADDSTEQKEMNGTLFLLYFEDCLTISDRVGDYHSSQNGRRWGYQNSDVT
ncbi:MAG: hypothetical protein LBL78_05375 [Prevotellaceae bacterium]|nr:hypothetical protein [Prevotellaceae bacterium]